MSSIKQKRAQKACTLRAKYLHVTFCAFAFICWTKAKVNIIIEMSCVKVKSLPKFFKLSPKRRKSLLNKYYLPARMRRR